MFVVMCFFFLVTFLVCHLRRERSLRALLDLLHRRAITLDTLHTCTCAPYKEMSAKEGEIPVQPWRW